jgi:hypothetical protein
MTMPEWKMEQPPVAEMLIPVRCMHCRDVYDLTHVHVTARYSDCSVWTSPCCGHANIDDRPWVRDRHYRKISKDEAIHGEHYDIYGMRGQW